MLQCQWGLDPPCPWIEFVILHAVQRSSAEIVMWARGSRSSPAPWDETANAGNLEMLRVLTALDLLCPWNSILRCLVSEGRHWDVPV
mmetsp:Transcript_6983/g.16087  ORF Transcript_6983/g.16087 Transcript_6983/m.16087 type:complete len:87 (+) Transcript_6983:749-1009(+)